MSDIFRESKLIHLLELIGSRVVMDMLYLEYQEFLVSDT